MSKTVQDILSMIAENGIQMVDFKMVDINGAYRHVSIPARNFSEETMKNGIGFDASNYGYAVVEKSDMVFIPDPDTAVIDPFCAVPTLSMTGNAMIIDYPENRPLAQYPRNIVRPQTWAHTRLGESCLLCAALQVSPWKINTLTHALHLSIPNSWGNMLSSLPGGRGAWG